MSHASLHLLVDGVRIGAAERATLAVLNPANGEELGRLPMATAADLDAAVAAATRTFPAWRALSPQQRGQLLRDAATRLRERADAIARLLTLEQGSVLARSRIEVMRGADVLDWCAEEGRRTYGRVIPGGAPGARQLVLHQPLGPALLLTPWNAPAFMPCRKLGEALAAGCTCIIKPAEETPATALAIVQALTDAGVPPGVVNVVFGDPAQISQRLIAAPQVRKVSFTGSTQVGLQLGALAGAHAKPVTLELGGHAPLLVFADADAQQVAALTATMKLNNGGQLCGSPTRILVQEAIYPRFLAHYRERLAAVRVGDGLDPAAQMGPLANARRVSAMEDFVADARARGARIACGGARVGAAGCGYQPTLITDADRDSRIMNVEPFGPISVIVPFASVEDAVTEANRLEFGLAAYAFTDSAAIAQQLVEDIACGMLGINSFAVTSPESPVSGVKASGHGVEGGSEGVLAYMGTKYVMHATR